LGNGFGFWKTMPIRRRRATGSVSGAVMSRPSKRIVPPIRALGIRSFIRLKQRRSVLLPHPDGPISAVIWLRGMLIWMSFKANDAPYQTDRASAERTTGSRAVGTSAWVSGRTGFADVSCSGIMGD
jgi:hypothetical protein